MKASGSWPSSLRPRVFVWLEGRRPERALQRALGAGVEIESVTSLGRGRLEIVLTPEMLRPLRQAVRGSARVRVRRRRGGPYVLRTLGRRPGLWAGALLFAVTLQALGSLVWQVRVEGVPTPLARRLLVAAEHQGIKPGVPRAWVQRDRAARLLERQVPDISWAGVQLDGGLVLIRAVPAVVPGAGEARSRRLVASHGGLVVSVHLRQGSPEVAAGQRVEAGQVLVRGYTLPGAVLADGSIGPSTWVSPHAVVVARWEATASGAAARVRPLKPLVRESIGWMATLRGRTLSEGGPPVAKDQERRSLVNWRIRLQGIEWMALQVERVTQTEHRVRRLSRSATAAAALAAAERNLLRSTGSDVRVMRRSVKTTWQGDTATVRIQAEVEGDIARPTGPAPKG